MPGFAIDHVQIAIPPRGEDLGRGFFGDLLGIEEIPKPAHMRARGGCWFDLGDVQIHLGVEAEFRPARKSHVALRTDRLEDLRERLGDAGYPIRDDEPIEGRARFFTDDPFGNRIEFVERPK
jgi:catechol 2,3-dioxygenase-like lactoylglutathione lyase family enzyme